MHHNFFNEKTCKNCIKFKNPLKNHKKGGEFSTRVFNYINIRIKIKNMLQQTLNKSYRF